RDQWLRRPSPTRHYIRDIRSIVAPLWEGYIFLYMQLYETGYGRPSGQSVSSPTYPVLSVVVCPVDGRENISGREIALQVLPRPKVQAVFQPYSTIHQFGDSIQIYHPVCLII